MKMKKKNRKGQLHRKGKYRKIYLMLMKKKKMGNNKNSSNNQFKKKRKKLI
jgi:hypothetical protein